MNISRPAGLQGRAPSPILFLVGVAPVQPDDRCWSTTLAWRGKSKHVSRVHTSPAISVKLGSIEHPKIRIWNCRLPGASRSHASRRWASDGPCDAMQGQGAGRDQITKHPSWGKQALLSCLHGASIPHSKRQWESTMSQTSKFSETNRPEGSGSPKSMTTRHCQFCRCKPAPQQSDSNHSNPSEADSKAGSWRADGRRKGGLARPSYRFAIIPGRSVVARCGRQPA